MSQIKCLFSNEPVYFKSDCITQMLYICRPDSVAQLVELLTLNQ
jgi:hypothetical protein